MTNKTGGNKGELSEFYVFLKILTDRKLISSDENLVPDLSSVVPIIKIIRKETGENIKTYELPKDKQKEIVILEEHYPPTILDSDRISTKLSTIFTKIATGSQNMAEIEKLLVLLKCSYFRGMPAGSKEDIEVVIHDPRTGLQPNMAYSIKSQVGSASTLLNASGATNFIYELAGYQKGDFQEKFNNYKGARNRINAWKDIKPKIKFFDTSNKLFRRNMELIDTAFPELMAALLLRHYTTDISSLREIVDSFGEYIELPKFNMRISKDKAIYSVKHFLAAVALGMTPSKPWDGTLSATGGYLILKRNGDLVCWHIYNIDSFKEYLFKTTRFERGSESRHAYGKFYKEKEKLHIKLNLQIRFRI